MTDRRPLIVLGLFVLMLIGGVAVHSATASSPSRGGGTSRTDTTMRPEGTTSVDPSGSGSGGWLEGLNRINTVENALYCDPETATIDPGVDSVMTSTCTCSAEAKKTLTQMAQSGQHVA